MVYALHKFRHYLLGNMFTFYVDQMALIYLVNKPQVSSMLVRWFLLFLEYDFKIVYKLGKSHLMVHVDARPHSLKDSNTSLKVKITKGVGVHSLVHNISGVGGCIGASRWGLK